MQEIEQPEDPNLKSSEFALIIADPGSAVGAPEDLFQRFIARRNKVNKDFGFHEFDEQFNPDIFLSVICGFNGTFVTRNYYRFDPNNNETQFPLSSRLVYANFDTPKVSLISRYGLDDEEISTVHLFQESTCHFARPYGQISLDYNDETGVLKKAVHYPDAKKSMILDGNMLKNLLSGVSISHYDSALRYELSMSGQMINMEIRKNKKPTDLIKIPTKFDKARVITQLIKPDLLIDQQDLSGKLDYTWRSADIPHLVGLEWKSLVAKRTQVFQIKFL